MHRAGVDKVGHQIRWQVGSMPDENARQNCRLNRRQGQHEWLLRDAAADGPGHANIGIESACAALLDSAPGRLTRSSQ